MDASSELTLFAELGAAFAGFIAIFLIFARREGRFSPADSLRIESIVFASFGAVFFSLVPLVLGSAGFAADRLWQASSLIALGAGLVVGGLVAVKQVRLSPEDQAEVGLLHSLITWGLFAVAGVLFALNAFGWAGEPSAWPYLTSLFCALGIAAMNFVTIALHRLL